MRARTSRVGSVWLRSLRAAFDNVERDLETVAKMFLIENVTDVILNGAHL